MSDLIGKLGFEFPPEYERIFEKTLSTKKPSEDIVKKHFKFVSMHAKTTTGLTNLNELGKFNSWSYVHFLKNIKRRGTKVEKVLLEEYAKARSDISKKAEELRTVIKEKEIGLQSGPIGFGVKSSEKRVPDSVNTV